MNDKISKFNTASNASKPTLGSGLAKPSQPSGLTNTLTNAASKISQNLTGKTSFSSSATGSAFSKNTITSAKSSSVVQSSSSSAFAAESISSSKSVSVSKTSQQATSSSSSTRTELRGSTTMSTVSSVANADLSFNSNSNIINTTERIPSLAAFEPGSNLSQNTPKSSSSLTLSHNSAADYLPTSIDETALSSNLSSMVLEGRDFMSGCTSPTSSEFSTTSSAATSDNVVVICSRKNMNKHDLATGYGFNEDQIGMFEDTFQIFDKDCDGFITPIEIRTVMNSLGFFPNDEKIRKGIEDIDTDNSGTVDFEEFIGMMSKFRQAKTSVELEEELKDIFNIFDKNQDGFIDKNELKDVLTRLGENITDEEVVEMVKEADLDGDNKVSFSEFKSILYDKK